jgi:hypothetical protein
MEYCEGGSLDAIYKQIKKRQGRTGEKVLGKVAEAVLNGLVYLHDHKIIHRGPLVAHRKPPRENTPPDRPTDPPFLWQISSHRISSSLETDRSRYATLAYLENS